MVILVASRSGTQRTGTRPTIVHIVVNAGFTKGVTAHCQTDGTDHDQMTQRTSHFGLPLLQRFVHAAREPRRRQCHKGSAQSGSLCSCDIVGGTRFRVCY
jgi:hypothetical protein